MKSGHPSKAPGGGAGWSDPDDRALKAYVLGTLPDEARARVEERLFADDGCLERIEAIETEIVDRYVAGRLSEPERTAFQRRLRESPRLAERVLTAGALAKAAALERARQPARLRVPWLAVAATLVLAVGGSLWMARRADTPSVPPTVAGSRPEGAGRLSAPDVPPPAPGEVAAPPAGAPVAPSEPRARGSVTTLWLSPRLLRSDSDRPTLVVGSGVSRIRIVMGIEAGDEYPAYRARISAASGEEVWQRDALKSSEVDGTMAVVAEIGAATLPPGLYELLLQGRSTAEELEDLAVHEFLVRAAR